MIVGALGISMGTHEGTEKKSSSTAKPQERDEAPEQADANIELRELNSAGLAIFGSAAVLVERTGESKIELGNIESAGSDTPQTAPDADGIKSPAQDHEPATDIPQTEPEAARSGVNRFSLLAACLALAAALGGMVGALAAYSLAQPVGPAVIATGSIGNEEFHVLKENVVQARVDLAALKASVDAANRNGNAQLTKVAERIERMERNQAEPAARLSKAAENLERIVRTETTGALVPPQPVGPRPGGADAWVLRDVRHGTAIIEGRTGTIEVDPGDVVPGMGRVEDIRKQDGRWVVLTSKGVITSRR
jgi:hypothetical protein